MGDVENELEVLQRKLAAKTREIEAFVAAQQRMRDPTAMDATEYERLRLYVEQVIFKWQEANVRRSPQEPDNPLNRLIAEREEIEQQIVALKVW
jgi:hypothetical protein